MLRANRKNGIIKFMETKINKIDRNQIDEELIQEAGVILKEGGLVAFPTETVYGLGANALDEEAAKKTYAAKGRPSDNPLIVHIADLEDLDEIVESVPQEAILLAQQFWPGPLTMIFQKSSIVPYGTTGGLETVAVRMPKDPIALKLILAAGGYVSAPSANTSGRPSPTDAKHVWNDLNGKIDMILDGGNVEIGLESTILDMTVTPPMILRPGAITEEMLEEVIGTISVDKSIMGEDTNSPPKAPGMKYRHYAPKANLMIVEGDLKEQIFAIRQIAYERSREGKQVGIIATEETVGFYTKGIIKNIGSRENEKTIARNLYRVLREFDEEDVSEIYSELFAVSGIGSAIMNRLEKAAGHSRILAHDIVKKQRYRRIVFVSDSDTCRGPIAAQILKQKDLRQEYWIDSKGLVVLFSEPINQKAEAVMKSNQLSLEGYTSKPLVPKDLNPDTLILAMEQNQKDKMLSEYANQDGIYLENIYTLNEFVNDDLVLPDPYGQPLTAYGECYEKINILIDKLVTILNSFTEGEV